VILSIFEVSVGQSVENLEPVEELFVASAEEKKIFNGWLYSFEEVFASRHVVSFITRESFEHVIPVEF
jgi:hypothetical protein